MESDQAEEVPVGEEERNWAELPRDALWVIFKKVAAVGVITSAQFVCRPWRLLSREPELWRSIAMMDEAGRFKSTDFESIAMMALDRSEGCVEEFYAEKFGTDALMSYLVCRASQLRCLRLKEVYDITETTLVKALRTFPWLEELEASICIISDEVLESISSACPKLKSLKLKFGKNSEDWRSNLEDIREHMLNFLYVPKVGLSALLNNCPHLECLHIDGCLIFAVDEKHKEKCARIKDLRLPIFETFGLPDIEDDDYD